MDGKLAADNIAVPVEAITPTGDNPNEYYGTIRFTVAYCGIKKNSIRIKFNATDQGEFLGKSWTYEYNDR